jgi:hypothetical protein
MEKHDGGARRSDEAAYDNGCSVSALIVRLMYMVDLYSLAMMFMFIIVVSLFSLFVFCSLRCEAVCWREISFGH